MNKSQNLCYEVHNLNLLSAKLRPLSYFKSKICLKPNFNAIIKYHRRKNLKVLKNTILLPQNMISLDSMQDKTAIFLYIGVISLIATYLAVDFRVDMT